MSFRIILPVAHRTWTRTKICWILANIFYILPDWFCLFHIFFNSRLEALILVHVIFQQRKQNKQTRNTKQDKKLPYFINFYDTLLSSHFSPALSHFICLLPFIAEFIERTVSISCYQIFTFYSFFNLFQLSFIHFIVPYLLLPSSMITFLFSSYSTSQQQFNMVNHFLPLETLAIF